MKLSSANSSEPPPQATPTPALHLEADTRTLLTEVDIDNADGVLHAGLYGIVRLSISRPQPVIVVPSNVVVFDANGLNATVDDSGVARRRCRRPRRAQSRRSCARCARSDPHFRLQHLRSVVFLQVVAMAPRAPYTARARHCCSLMHSPSAARANPTARPSRY